MKSPSVGNILWSTAFAIGALVLLTITESFVTVMEPSPTSPQGALAVSRSGASRHGGGAAIPDAHEQVPDGDQRARR